MSPRYHVPHSPLQANVYKLFLSILESLNSPKSSLNLRLLCEFYNVLAFLLNAQKIQKNRSLDLLLTLGQSITITRGRISYIEIVDRRLSCST
jgi:hypothetical protein